MIQTERTKPQIAVKSPLKPSVSVLIALAIVSATAAVVMLRPWPLSLASKVVAGQPMTEATEATAFGPTIPNIAAAPAPAPAGMVWISGGEFAMGAMDPPANDEVGMQAATDARPVHRVYVD